MEKEEKNELFKIAYKILTDKNKYYSSVAFTEENKKIIDDLRAKYTNILIILDKLNLSEEYNAFLEEKGSNDYISLVHLNEYLDYFNKEDSIPISKIKNYVNNMQRKQL